MRKRRNDFKQPKNQNNIYYDLYDDWNLIEASFTAQYGIRLRQVAKEMSWSEFCSFISGLLPDTPLGQIVAIRAEKNPKVIRNFTPEQKKIYREWQDRQAKKKLNNPEQLEKEMNDLANAFRMMFGKKEVRK